MVEIILALLLQLTLLAGGTKQDQTSTTSSVSTTTATTTSTTTTNTTNTSGGSGETTGTDSYGGTGTWDNKD